MNGKTNHGVYKRVLLVFVMAVLCALFAVSASAETISGECGKQGDNVTWTLDTETGTLTIAGEGEMADYQDYSYDTPWNSYQIETVVICNGVTSVGSCAFDGLESLIDVVLPNKLTSIGYSAFFCCNSLKKIEIPENVKRIEETAFYGCDTLANIILPNSVEYIGDAIFCSCDNLIEAKLPDNITEIPASMFYYTGLKSIEIPSSVRTIGRLAFANTDLEELVIPSSVLQISENAFYYIAELKQIIVDDDNPCYYSDSFGALFDKSDATLIQYPIGNLSPSYSVPEGTQRIARYAFGYSTNLEELIIPNSVTYIGDSAFRVSKKLNKVILGEGLTNLQDVTPNDPNDGIFSGCQNLETVYIPKTIPTIPKGTFWNCSNLSHVYYSGTESDWEGIEIESHNSGLSEKDIHFESEISIVDSTCIEKGYHVCTCPSCKSAFTFCEIELSQNHVYDDAWTYDYNNMIRFCKCIYCNEPRMEQLESSGGDDVEIIAPANPDTEFVVEEITKNGDKYAVVERTLSENLEGSYSILKTFDITLKNKDGVHVQPDGTVKVKLPLDWDKDGDYKVYRVNDDGTLTDMEAYREGSHMVFDTDHFSVYVIVDESPEQPQEENDSPFGFIAEIIRMFKELLSKIITFFQSIGDMT